VVLTHWAELSTKTQRNFFIENAREAHLTNKIGKTSYQHTETSREKSQSNFNKRRDGFPGNPPCEEEEKSWSVSAKHREKKVTTHMDSSTRRDILATKKIKKKVQTFHSRKEKLGQPVRSENGDLPWGRSSFQWLCVAWRSGPIALDLRILPAMICSGVRFTIKMLND
jgi:hypothetical protein